AFDDVAGHERFARGPSRVGVDEMDVAIIGSHDDFGDAVGSLPDDRLARPTRAAPLTAFRAHIRDRAHGFVGITPHHGRSRSGKRAGPVKVVHGVAAELFDPWY